MSNVNLKQAFNTLDEVIQEVVSAEQISLEIICIKLQEENLKIKSSVIDKIIAILRQWNKIPSSEIKVKTEELLKS